MEDKESRRELLINEMIDVLDRWAGPPETGGVLCEESRRLIRRARDIDETQESNKELLKEVSGALTFAMEKGLPSVEETEKILGKFLDSRNAEIDRLTVAVNAEIKLRKSQEIEIAKLKDDHGRARELYEELKKANGLLTHLRSENRDLRTRLVAMADLAEPHIHEDPVLKRAVRDMAVKRAREALA